MEDIRLLPVTIGTRAMHEDLPEEDDDKFWLRIIASNDKLDRHNSMMDPKTTLKNFEKDAKAKLGVSLKDHHGFYGSRSFGYGRSVDAKLTDENELLIDFFILKAMDYSNSHFKSAEQLIRAIEHELVNQVSIGFYNAREICNLCNLPIRRYSYWDWEPEREGQCTHKMGKKYENKNGKMETASYTVYDARLKEVSLVEFGSNRHTSIEKKRFGDTDVCDEVSGALRWIFTQKQEGHPFSNEMRSFMEELLMNDQEWITSLRDKLNIPDIQPTDDPEKVVEAVQTEVSKLREQDADRNKQHVISLRDALSLKDVRSTDDLDTVVEKAKTEIEGIRETVETQRDEIADLQADAEAGKTYREARVDEAIKQGNRAYGDDFDEAYHREYYGAMPMDQLEKHIAHNKKKGDEALPAGRRTQDTHEPPPEREKMGTRQRQRRTRRR
ncbi:hypothetical protein F4X10_06580 [Candidatus Poribacteria bacterium]|nr:hypothetical protein [Candidatus Poribacteria bacterium]MYC75419.1 hypothetical protein [Candidatus Poribacteria bacterium]